MSFEALTSAKYGDFSPYWVIYSQELKKAFIGLRSDKMRTGVFAECRATPAGEDDVDFTDCEFISGTQYLENSSTVDAIENAIKIYVATGLAPAINEIEKRFVMAIKQEIFLKAIGAVIGYGVTAGVIVAAVRATLNSGARGRTIKNFGAFSLALGIGIPTTNMALDSVDQYQSLDRNQRRIRSAARLAAGILVVNGLDRLRGDEDGAIFGIDSILYTLIRDAFVEAIKSVTVI